MNPIYETIQDAVIACLEQENEGIWLPDEFEIMIDDAAFQVLLKGLVMPVTRAPMDMKKKRVLLSIQGHRVTIRSDKDPEQWAIILRSEGLH